MMKSLPYAALAALALSTTPALAHHLAEDVVDEEIYAMIDAAVADTPHAEMTLEDLGGGMVMTTVTTDSIDAMSDFLDDGGLGYIEELDGVTYINIDLNDDGSATLNVQQYPQP